MSCYDYCSGRLRGIVDNQKLLGELPDDFQVEIRPIRPGVSWLPKGSYTATCEHGRKFLMREAKPKKII